MVEFLTYDLKVAVLIAVFYMFYRLLLSRETFHRVNRAVLLLTAIASYVLPLCVITLHKTVVVEATGTSVDFGGLAMMVEEAPQMPLWQLLAVVIFLIGVVATLGNTLLSILRVWLLIRRSEQHPQPDGTVVCVAPHDVSPFSWMHYIVLSRNDYHTPPEGSGEAFILAHERGHIRQHHSVDLILVDTLTALQWFNPAMWMLRQDLRAIHEYEADAAVLSQGINMRQYQYLLIQKAVSHCGYSVANGISHSTLKNRINMMLTNKKTNRASLLKLLALVPIVGVALALNAETVNDYVYTEKAKTPQKKVVKKGRQDGQIKMGTKTIEVKAMKVETDEGTYTGENVKVELDKEQLKRPLIVVDGKRVDNPDEFIKNLDPASVDHIEVLKNEELKEVYSKIYGGDASEGVVVITTKKHAAEHKAKMDKEERHVVDVTVAKSQEETEKGVFGVVEEMPQYPGGQMELMKFLSETVKYPEAAEKAGTQGRVIASFIVEKDGSISGAKVVRSVSEELDAEALRVINAMPKWMPGKQSGKAVRVKYTIPISFRLK